MLGNSPVFIGQARGAGETTIRLQNFLNPRRSAKNNIKQIHGNLTAVEVFLVIVVQRWTLRIKPTFSRLKLFELLRILGYVGGFLQRMDLARKYAFGKMLIIGSEPPFKVKGLWLFRGKEIPKFVLDECYDMELYEWKQVDITDEAQKERVSQMIEDYEPFEGESLLDAKCFK
ncbi:elongation factor 1-gamma 2-like protein [Tanacetum coccineum]